jgi:hypothetical protein
VRASPEAPIYDLPLTVSIQYGDKTVDEIVAVTDTQVEKRIRLTGTVKAVDVNADGAALAVLEKR